MKDLTDFVTLGKEFGLKDDKLLTFAESKYDSYLKSLDEERKLAERAYEEKKLEAERAEKAHERELRLLERRAQIAQDERVVAKTAGSGGRVPHLMSHHSDLHPLMTSQMTLILGSHCLKNNVPLIMSRIETEKRICYPYLLVSAGTPFYL